MYYTLEDSSGQSGLRWITVEYGKKSMAKRWKKASKLADSGAKIGQKLPKNSRI